MCMHEHEMPSPSASTKQRAPFAAALILEVSSPDLAPASQSLGKLPVISRPRTVHQRAEPVAGFANGMDYGTPTNIENIGRLVLTF